MALSDEQIQITDAVTRFAERHATLEQLRPHFEACAAGELPPFWTELVAQAGRPSRSRNSAGRAASADAACVLEAAGYGCSAGAAAHHHHRRGCRGHRPGPGGAPAAPFDRRWSAGGDPGARHRSIAFHANGLRLDPGRLHRARDRPAGTDHILISARGEDGRVRWFALAADHPGVQVLAETPTDLTRRGRCA
jgi:hypothetical protein